MQTIASRNSSTPMKRSLARAIFRESRCLQSQGPNAGFQVPAMYDICNSVNPNSGGLILQSDLDYQKFVKNHFTSWTVSQDFVDSHKLRYVLPTILDNLDGNEKRNLDGFYSKPGFIRLDTAGNPLNSCPFELLRALKFQNQIGESASKTENEGLHLAAITGFSRLHSDAAGGEHQQGNGGVEHQQGGENVFAYNILFTNTTNQPVQIIGHDVKFLRQSGVAGNRDGNPQPQRGDNGNGKMDILKEETFQGVNNTVPTILPGEQYICGATVAFPKGIDGLFLSGSFHVLQGQPSRGIVEKIASEDMPLEEKCRLLKQAAREINQTINGTNGKTNTPLTLRTVDLAETAFRAELECDEQPLEEKLGSLLAEPAEEEGKVSEM